jgi:hypothetical protein
VPHQSSRPLGDDNRTEVDEDKAGGGDQQIHAGDLEKDNPDTEVIDCHEKAAKGLLEGQDNGNTSATGCSKALKDSTVRAGASEAMKRGFARFATTVRAYKDSPYFIAGIVAFGLGILVLLLAGVLIWQYRSRAITRASRDGIAMQFLTASELACAGDVDSAQGTPHLRSHFPSPLMSSSGNSAILSRDIAPYDINTDYTQSQPLRTPRVYSYNSAAAKK